MNILNKAGVVAVTVDPESPVIEAVRLMKESAVDTLFVAEDSKVIGAFTQRDLAFRVVLSRLDPEATAVREVMTSPAITLPSKATVADALQMMAENRVPQLAVVNAEGLIKGMVTLRDIFREQTIDLTEELDALIAYHTADGIGG